MLGCMGRRWVWAAVTAVALTAAVLALRAPAPTPPSPPPPAPEQAERVRVEPAGWWLMAAPEGALSYRVHREGGQVVVADGLLGSRAVERTGDVLSIVDLATGVRESSSGHPAAGPIIVTQRALVLQESSRCVEFVDPGDLERRSRHCVAEGVEISLLGGDAGGPQWREVASGESCAKWFRLGGDGQPQQLNVGAQACRSALLVRTGGWELTAEFPPYQMGVAHPGPLVAHRAGREITLDSSVVDIEVCGTSVYWLSGAGGLVQWRPGETRVEVWDLPDAKTLRCVNGALSAVTPTGVWLPGQR